MHILVAGGAGRAAAEPAPHNNGAAAQREATRRKHRKHHLHSPAAPSNATHNRKTHKHFKEQQNQSCLVEGSGKRAWHGYEAKERGKL